MLGKANIPCQLDEGQCIAIQRHKELVKKNRHSLSRIVDCIKFCGAHELALTHIITMSATEPYKYFNDKGKPVSTKMKETQRQRTAA